MARLSLKEAVDWLTANGYEFGDKRQVGFKYYIKKDDKEICFETGSKIVAFVKRNIEDNSFNKDKEVQKLNNLKDLLEEVEFKMGEVKYNSSLRELYNKQRRLEKDIKEQEAYIEFEGKIYTPNRIHQILRDAGYEVVKSETTRVRGWHNYYGDYTLDTGYENRKFFHLSFNGNKEKKRNEILAVLQKHNIDVTVDGEELVICRRVV